MINSSHSIIKRNIPFEGLNYWLLVAFFSFLSIIPISQVELSDSLILYLPIIALFFSTIFIQCLMLKIDKNHFFLLFWGLSFIILVLLSMLQGTLKYMPLEILLSALPFFTFFMLPIFLHALRFLWSSNHRILYLILIPTTIYSAKFLYFTYIIITQYGGARRLTWLTFDSVASLNVLGFIISCICLALYSKKFYWGIWSVILLVPIIFTFTRGIMLSLAIVFLYVSLRYGLVLIKKSIPVIATICLLLGGAIPYIASSSILKNVLGLYTKRFETVLSDKRDGGESARLNEIDMGFQAFLERPVLGQSMGFQITSRKGDGTLHTARYIHNGSVYILMNFGLIGFILYYGIPSFLWLWLTKKPLPVDQKGKLWKIYFEASFLYLLLFSQIFAVVRLIHFNLFFLLHTSAIFFLIIKKYPNSNLKGVQ